MTFDMRRAASASDFTPMPKTKANLDHKPWSSPHVPDATADDSPNPFKGTWLLSDAGLVDKLNKLEGIKKEALQRRIEAEMHAFERWQELQEQDTLAHGGHMMCHRCMSLKGIRCVCQPEPKAEPEPSVNCRCVHCAPEMFPERHPTITIHQTFLGSTLLPNWPAQAYKHHLGEKELYRRRKTAFWLQHNFRLA